MGKNKAVWVALSVASAPIGVALTKTGVIGANPGTFFALGVLACLSVGGILYGLVDGPRTAREGRRIGN